MGSGGRRVKVRLFGCGKFGWLSSEAEDRPLTAAELRFIERHKEVCPQCVAKEAASACALNMLREAKIEADVPEQSFETRLIRRLRVQSVRLGFHYWTPALFGAAIAAVALASALQLLARTHELPVFRAGHFEAKRIQVADPEFPSIRIAERISDSR